MDKIDPALLAELLTVAGYKTPKKPSKKVQRLAAALVERCAGIADHHECADANEAGADIRAQFGLGA